MLDVNENRPDPLNVLRVVAWFLVFETHVTIWCPKSLFSSLKVGGHNVSWILLTPAHAGVWLFFILSGFLIGRGFATRRYEVTLPEVRRFWANRAWRIAPLYYFALFVAIVFVAPAALRPENWRYVARMLTFTYNGALPINPDGALWFVSTLVQFYLLVPLIVLALGSSLLDRRKGLVVFAGVLALGLAIRWAPTLINWLVLGAKPNVSHYWYRWVYTPIWANLDLFVGGMLINAFVPPGSRARFGRTGRAAAVLVLVVLVVCSSYLYYQGNIGHQRPWALYVAGFPSLYLCAAALWITAFGVRTSRVPLTWRRVVRHPALLVDALALLTYGIFVWHAPILESVSPILQTGRPLTTYALVFTVGLALCVAMAATTYLGIERPASRRMRRRTEAADDAPPGRTTLT